MNKDDDGFDEFCDPSNPRKIKYEDIVTASRRISGTVLKTPCRKAHMSEKHGMEIYLKQEAMQFTGCFKERGIRNALANVTDDQKRMGVVTFSSGNHGAALGVHGSQLGIPCVVVLPTNVANIKLSKSIEFGAKVILHGANLDEAKKHAMLLAKEKKMLYIDAYDHPHIIEGHGTIGLEVLEQVPTADAMLVPVGSGALLCGVAVAAKHLKPDLQIYGVCTERTYSMVESLRKNERLSINIESSLADAIAVSMVGVNAFYNIKGLVDKMIVVREDWVARAIMRLVEEERFVVEGAGAVTVAAIMAGLFPYLRGKKVVCIVSGGNIDAIVLSRSLERGMGAEGRLVKFKVTVTDRPGGLAEFCALLASIGVTLRDCVPARDWVTGDIFSVELKVLAETRGWDHTKDLQEHVKKHYKEFSFTDLSEKKVDLSRRGPCLAPHPVCMQK